MGQIMIAFISGAALGVVIMAIATAATLDRMSNEQEQLREALAVQTQRTAPVSIHNTKPVQKPSNTIILQDKPVDLVPASR